MHKEKQITLGHYTEKKLLELLPYGLANPKMPRIPVFGFASQQTPADVLAEGNIPSRELIEYWKGSNWTKAENKEHLKRV